MSAYQPPPGQQPYAQGQPSPYPPPTPPPAGPPPELLAGQGARLGARLLDGVILTAALIAVSLVFRLFLLLVLPIGDGTRYYIAILVILLVLVILYEPVMTLKYGATLGKRACGLRVARIEDGGLLPPGRAFGRWGATAVMGIVPLLPVLDALWCCWDRPYRQCLHDKAVRSVVVKRAG